MKDILYLLSSNSETTLLNFVCSYIISINSIGIKLDNNADKISRIRESESRQRWSMNNPTQSENKLEKIVQLLSWVKLESA